MRKLSWVPTVIVLFIFSGTVARAQQAADAPRAVPEESVSANKPVEIQSAERLRTYWTPERIKAAIPMPLETVVLPAGADPRKRQPAPTPTGPFTVSPPNLPSRGAMARLAAREPVSDFAGALASRVPNVGMFPYASSGALFFTNNGTNYRCSAGAIGDSVYLTAGHCIYNPTSKTWSTNLIFIAQYAGSSGPYQYGWSLELALNGWINNSDRAYDIGMVRTPNSMVGDIGHMGWMANYPANTSPWTAVGYPGNNSYPGNYMYATTGNYLDGSSILHMSNNDMHSGSSGGAWMASMSGTLGYANGLNSFHYDNDQGTEYSPYFGQGFVNEWNCAANNVGCP
jgi:V8-like Glu-specific endopeptidase